MSSGSFSSAMASLSAVTSPNDRITSLTGDNSVVWKVSLMLNLAFLYFNFALNEDEPPALTAESTPAQHLLFKKWKRCNCMSLMLMKNSISMPIRGSIPDSENAKTYMDSVEEQFKGTSKAHASTLILRLVTTKYDGRSGIRGYIMMMNDMTHKMKGLDMEINDGFLVHFIMTSLPTAYEASRSITTPRRTNGL
ncbi:uncharacterized protein LOC143593393 [Bidens hawaiensis]|uniref:uncharacterized protein LOC143593393 n=1 Tax=Bidens hawaiensis TaxID=980011 RepID=UPI00404B1151